MTNCRDETIYKPVSHELSSNAVADRVDSLGEWVANNRRRIDAVGKNSHVVNQLQRQHEQLNE